MTSSALALNTIDDTYRMAKGLVSSGLLPKAIKTNEQAFAIITLGQELGFAAWQSILSIDVIQGKPTLKPQAMLALIRQSGLAEKIDIPDTSDISKAQAATVTMTRKGGQTHTTTFSMEMANAMETSEWIDGKKITSKLSAKYNWRTMPEIMMMWRAVSACARVLFPDVILGMYTSDEISADDVTPAEMTIQQSAPVVTIEPPQLASGEAVVPEEEAEAEQTEPIEPVVAATATTPKPDFDPATWLQASAKAWLVARLNNAEFGSPTSDMIFNALGIKTKLSEFKGGGWDAADAALVKYMATPADQRSDPVRDADVRLGTKGAKLGTFPAGMTPDEIKKVTTAMDAVVEESFNEIVGEDEIEDALLEDNIQDLAADPNIAFADNLIQNNNVPARQWFEPKVAPAPAAAIVAFAKDDMKTLIVEGRVHMQQIGKNKNSVRYSFNVIGDLGHPNGAVDERIKFAEVWSREVFKDSEIDATKWPKDAPEVLTEDGLWIDLGWSSKNKTTFSFECEFDGKGNWLIKGMA